MASTQIPTRPPRDPRPLASRSSCRLVWGTTVAVWMQALYILANTTYWTSRSISPIPFWDSWQIVFFFTSGQPVSLEWLWSHHNEHRILIPRLISLVDYRFFGGCGYFDLTSIWLMQVGSALLMAFVSLEAIGRTKSLRPWRILSCGFILCCASASVQMENFYWAFQTAFVGMVFFSILAFFCLKRSMEASNTLVWIAGGALSAIASALCLTSGLVTMFIFAVGCWIARVPRRALFVVLLVFGAFTAAYFHGYATPERPGSPIDALLHHRVLILEYLIVFMGNTFRRPEGIGFIPGPIQAAMMGSGGLALFVAAVSYALLNRNRRDVQSNLTQRAAADRDLSSNCVLPAQLALFSLSAMVIGEGFITALGRYKFGLWQALSSRYTTPVSFFWSAVLVLMVASILDQWPRSRGLPAVACALVLVTVGQITLQERSIAEGLAGRSSVLELAANAWRVGIVDLDAFRSVSPWPEQFTKARPFLLRHRLSIFSDNRYTWLGKHIDDIASLSPPDSCLGSFDLATQAGVKGGAKVFGWAWSTGEEKAPKQIILAGDGGIIVGLASSGLERSDVVAAVPQIKDRKTGWQGYSKETRNVSAYALIEGGREACRLPGSFDVVPVSP